MMVATVFIYPASSIGYGLTAARCFRIQLPLYGLVALVTAVACLWLVPSRGMLGAAMAILLAAAVQAVCSAVILFFAIRRADRNFGWIDRPTSRDHD